MDEIKKVLVWFTKAPTGHSRLKEDMRNALIGMTLMAIPHRNCFITDTNDLLEAIRTQRSQTVYTYWEAVLKNGPTTIYLGKSECSVVHTIELTSALPSTGLHKKILRACIGLKIRLPENAFDPKKNGFNTQRLSLLLGLKNHNPGLYLRRISKLPAKKLVGKVFLPAHICKPILR